MPDFVEVDHDPFAQDNVQLIPVDYNPFENTTPRSKYYLASRGVDTGPKPIEYQPSTEGRKYDFPYEEGHAGFPVSRATARIFGTHGEERYQFFPERMVRSIGEAMVDPSLDTSKGLGLPSEKAIEGAFSAAGLAGGAPLAIKPGVASLGSGLIRPMVKNINEVPAFYSAVENAVNGITQPKMLGKDWIGSISNKPGVKPEEMQFTGLNKFLEENKDKPVTKQEIQNFINENKVQVNEVDKGPKINNTPRLKQINARLDEIQNEYNSIHEKYPDYTTERPPEVQEKLAALVKEERELVKEHSYKTFQSEEQPSTKYQFYQLPGGENYREKLFILPKQNNPFKQRINELENRRESIQDEFNALDIQPETPELAAKRLALYNETNANNAELKQLIERENKEWHNNNPNYQSSHWDEPNVLAHVRMNDRTIEGQKSLHIEEIQSDWHQAGRDKGYSNDTKLLQDELDASGYPISDEGAKQAFDDGIITEHDYNELLKDKVPDAPFKKTWPDLVVKRMVREAAEKGYDKLSWTPGEAQAARYDLSKQVQDIGWNKQIQGNDTIVRINPNDGNTIALQMNKDGKIVESHPRSQAGQFEGKHLSDIVGKDIAEKIIGQEEGKLSGEGLKVGGEGMKGFYDQIIPKIVEKITGQKVKTANLPSKVMRAGPEDWRIIGDDGKGLRRANGEPLSFKTQEEALNHPGAREVGKVHYIDIPQKLKDTALQKGFPLFSGAGHMLTPVEHDPFENDK